jgi:ribonucleotide reductase beta subunit family protein with ferritin-like domain
MSIFKESESYRPFTYPWAVEAEKRQTVELYWHEGQIDLQDELRQYHSKGGLTTPTLSHEHNKEVVDKLLPFFTQLDMKVAEGYVELIPHTKNNEILSLFIAQAAKEVRHQRAYALAGETFGFTDTDWVAFQQYKEMREKIELMGNSGLNLHKPINYAYKLASVFCSEGIGLFAAFTALLNYKRYGKLIGFNDVNQWSLTDEQEHVENNIKVFQHILSVLSENEQKTLKKHVFSLVDEFVKAEHSIIDMLGKLEGIDTQDFKDYISYLGRLMLFRIGYIGSLELGTIPKSMTWMEDLLTAEKHGAFFEKRVTDYSHKKLEGKVDYDKYKVLLA